MLLFNHQIKTEGVKMTKAEKKAIEARKKDLEKQGINSVLAEVMAKAEFDCGLIKVVVNYN